MFNTKIVFNSRKVISPKELDIYFPELHKAIEINGNYWHSDKIIKKRTRNKYPTSYDYHKMKYDLCIQKDIELIFIWEKDWQKDKDYIIDKLSNWLKYDISDPVFQKFIE